MLSPEELFMHPEVLCRRYDGITMLRRIPLFVEADTPTASLYRMYDFLCANNSNQLMLEAKYFWQRGSWRLRSLPDPQDENPERSAVLASVVESLVLAFNWKMKLLGLRRDSLAADNTVSQHQMETSPSWTSEVPKLNQKLVLYASEALTLDTKTPFTQRNIVANAGNLFSI